MKRDLSNAAGLGLFLAFGSIVFWGFVVYAMISYYR